MGICIVRHVQIHVYSGELNKTKQVAHFKSVSSSRGHIISCISRSSRSKWNDVTLSFRLFLQNASFLISSSKTQMSYTCFEPDPTNPGIILPPLLAPGLHQSEMKGKSMQCFSSMNAWKATFLAIPIAILLFMVISVCHIKTHQANLCQFTDSTVAQEFITFKANCCSV